MQRGLLLFVLVPLASCTVDVYVHDLREGAPAVSPTANEAVASGVVRGVVRDMRGRPVRAQVAAVGPSGSTSCSTNDEGRFELSGIEWLEFTVHVSTNDAQLAVLPSVRCGTSGLDLVVQPAATLNIRIDGAASSRCAILHDGIRVQDFTVRAEKPASVVVPPGAVLIRLYDGDTIHAERTVQVKAGESLPCEFSIGK